MRTCSTKNRLRKLFNKVKISSVPDTVIDFGINDLIINSCLDINNPRKFVKKAGRMGKLVVNKTLFKLNNIGSKVVADVAKLCFLLK